MKIIYRRGRIKIFDEAANASKTDSPEGCRRERLINRSPTTLKALMSVNPVPRWYSVDDPFKGFPKK